MAHCNHQVLNHPKGTNCEETNECEKSVSDAGSVGTSQSTSGFEFSQRDTAAALKLLGRSIECAVCLERLRISDNRVLPCQHTYHIACLRLVLAREGELKCPECRKLCVVSIDKLLPNYTLNKILESLPPLYLGSTSQSQMGMSLGIVNKSEQTAVSNDCSSQSKAVLCVALYNYKAQHPGCLSLNQLDVVRVTHKLNSDWLKGEIVGNEQLSGCFPANHVRLLHKNDHSVDQIGISNESSSSSSPLWCTALSDFDHQVLLSCQQQKPFPKTNLSCLTFKRGDEIEVLGFVDRNWALGALRCANHRATIYNHSPDVGLLPLNFVELNQSCRTKTVQENESRVRVASQSSSLTTSLNLPHASQKTLPIQSNVESGAHKIYPSANKWPIQTTSLSRASSSSSSGDGDKIVHFSPPVLCVAVADYVAVRRDEICLLKGSRYYISKKFSDGWYKGFDATSHKEGAFPANFVLLIDSISSTKAASNDHNSLSVSNKPNIYGRTSLFLPRMFVAIYDYQSMFDDEISLVRGRKYYVNRIQSDGWYEGVDAASSNRQGVFPGNYVTPADMLSECLEGLKKESCATTLFGSSTVQPPKRNIKKETSKQHFSRFFNIQRDDHKKYRTLDAAGKRMSLEVAADPFQQINFSTTYRESPSSPRNIVPGMSCEETNFSNKYIAIAAYPPQNDSEVELEVGDIVEKENQQSDNINDGWIIGTVLSNNKTGLIPFSFLEKLSETSSQFAASSSLSSRTSSLALTINQNKVELNEQRRISNWF